MMLFLPQKIKKESSQYFPFLFRQAYYFFLVVVFLPEDEPLIMPSSVLIVLEDVALFDVVLSDPFDAQADKPIVSIRAIATVVVLFNMVSPIIR